MLRIVCKEGHITQYNLTRVPDRFRYNGFDEWKCSIAGCTAKFLFYEVNDEVQHREP